MIYIQDKRLPLSDGRVLAYADNGNTLSSTVVLFLHRAFTVGDASRISPTLQQHKAHLISPSLPGWGESSPVPDPARYAETVVADMSALLMHLHPHNPALKLYIVGHSFGCVTAQILMGASYDSFVFGRSIAGLILLAPLSPPHCHQDYARYFSWSPYFLAGPVSQYFPFSLIVPRLAKLFISKYLKSEDAATNLMRAWLFSGTCDDAAFSQWRLENNVKDGQYERECGTNAIRSVARTWRGLLDMSAIYHSRWGNFCPCDLDESHVTIPIFIITSRNDRSFPIEQSEWLAKYHKTATLEVVEGDHLATLFHLEKVWTTLLN